MGRRVLGAVAVAVVVLSAPPAATARPGSGPQAAAFPRSGAAPVEAAAATTPPPATVPSGGCVRPGNRAGVSCRFVDTGRAEAWTVPEGVGTVRLAVHGAQGARATAATGSRGAVVEVLAPVRAREVLVVEVGREGRAASTGGMTGREGGGPSVVRDAAGPWVVAGGGRGVVLRRGGARSAPGWWREGRPVETRPFRADAFRSGGGLVLVGYEQDDPDGLPSVVVTPLPGLLGAGTARFHVTFSEPVTGFTAGDVVLGGVGAGPRAVTLVPLSATRHDLVVAGLTTSGVLTVTVPSSVATDDDFSTNAASRTVATSVVGSRGADG